MTDPTARQALMQFGFSETEADVYCCLLQLGTATGYRVSQEVGRAAANVYASLETLLDKGAVSFEQGKSRRYRAVQPAELLHVLQLQFERQKFKAEAALSALRTPFEDAHVYQIQEFDQALAHAATLIANARSTILLDVFPAPLNALEPSLEAAAKRGVKIAFRCYGPAPAIHRSTIVVTRTGEKQRKDWPGEHLHMVVDATHYMLALFDRGFSTVLQAVTSESAFLGCIYHSALLAEIAHSFEPSNPLTEKAKKELRSLTVLTSRPEGLLKLQDWVERGEPTTGDGKIWGERG